jgi:hypothetical protein
MPPPKLSVMPGLRMSTRAGNKDKHPGIVDLPSPRRDHDDGLGEDRQRVAAKKEAELEAKKKAELKALQELACIEDAQLREAEDREQKRRTGRKSSAYMFRFTCILHVLTTLTGKSNGTSSGSSSRASTEQNQTIQPKNKRSSK